MAKGDIKLFDSQLPIEVRLKIILGDAYDPDMDYRVTTHRNAERRYEQGWVPVAEYQGDTICARPRTK